MSRIAFFTETFLPKVDGVVNTLCHLLDHLAAHGHTTLLFAPEGAPAQYAKTEVVTWRGVRFPQYPEMQLVPPFVNPRPGLEKFQPDIVHLVNPVSLGLAGLLAARQMRIPVLASYHTDLPGFARRWGAHFVVGPLVRYLRWVHNQCHLTLTPSRFTQAQLRASGYRRVQVWKRGVDTEQFSPQRRAVAWRQKLSGGHPDAPLLLYVGRLSPEKRIEWLRPVLDALAQARLAIVGDGPSRSSLERLFAGTPTTFAGYLRGDDLAAAYASADIFVFPSPNETLGNVVLEAMASALPVVAPRSGGLLDHVTDGKLGLLFEPEQVNGLIDAVRLLVDRPGYGMQLGEAGRRYTEVHTWATTLDEVTRAYEHVLSRAAYRSRSHAKAGQSAVGRSSSQSRPGSASWGSPQVGL